MTRLNRNLFAWLLLASVSVLTACSGGEPTTLHLLPAPPKVSDAEQERMRRMQAVMAYDEVTKETFEVGEAQLYLMFYGKCSADLPSVPVPSACASQLVSAAISLCIAKTWIATLRPQVSPVRVDHIQGVTHTASGGATIPLQSAAATVQLAQWAKREAMIAADEYAGTIEAMGGTPRAGADTGCLTTGSTFAIGGTLGGTFGAAGFRDAYATYRDATEALIQGALNTSDAELSSTGSLTLASQRSLTERRLGVAAAAIGGTAEVLPFAENGAYCTLGRPREQVRAAIAVLRDSGIDPAQLGSSTDTTDLLNGTTFEPPGGSVRQRIAQFYGKPELNDTALVPRLEDFYNIDISAFEEARKYLNQEIAAYSRTGDILPARKAPDGTAATIHSFVATSSLPVRLPAAYYGAIARTNDTTRIIEQQAYTPGDSLNDGARRAGQDWDYLFGAAANLLQATGGFPETALLDGNSVQLQANASAPIASMLASGDYIGHVAGVRGEATDISFQVYGLDSGDALLLAQGERALRCAVQGSIEGAPCDLSQFDYSSGIFSPFGVGIEHFGLPKSASFWANVVNPDLGNRFYLLRSTTGSTNAPAGKWEAVIGVTLVPSKPYAIFPIIKGMDERMQALLEPAPDSCARPRFNCDGADFDERIPLEDELTDNGDGVENSWKHYLDLAKQAAAKADELGSDYIQSGLEDAERKETIELRQQQQMQLADSYLQRVQAICGTQVDTRALMTKLLGSSGGGLKLTSAECNDVTDCNNSEIPSTCVQGRCIVDIPQLLVTFGSIDPSIQRLRDCLSTWGNLPFVSLGSNPLCIWRDHADPNILCSHAAPGTCPKEKNANQSCTETTLASMPTAPKQDLYETVALSLFDMGPPPTADSVRTRSPDNFRVLAEQGLTPESWARWKDGIIAHHFLDPITLYTFGQRLSWEARYNGFAAITFDSSMIYQTGSAAIGVKNDEWPCSPPDPPTTPPQPPEPPYDPAVRGPYVPGLVPKDCNDPKQRYEANMTMFRAVVAAKALTAPVARHNDNTSGGTQRNLNDVTVGPIPFDGGCGGDVVSRDTQNYYWDGRGILHANYTVGDQYTTAPPIDAWWYPGFTLVGNHLEPALITSQAACFHAEAPFRVETTYNRDLNKESATPSSLLVDMSSNDAEFGYNPITSYLNGVPKVGLDIHAGVVNWDEGNRLIDRESVYLTPRDYLNAIGLIAQRAAQPPAVNFNAPPIVRTVDDLEAVSQYLIALGDSIKQSAGMSVFANVPQKVVEALRSNSSVGAYPQYGGETAQQLSATRAAMLKIRENSPLLANEIQQMGYDLRDVRTLLEKSAIKRDIAKLQFMSTMTQQLATCAAAMVSGIGIDPRSTVAAAVTCANSIAQISFASGIQNLTGQDSKLDGDLAISQFGARFAAHSTALQTLSLHLSEGKEELDSALTKIESLRNEANSQLVNAIYAASEQAQHQAEVSNVIGNLYEAKQLRYMAALSKARRMSFLAKRAIEQRLGIRMADMTEDLPLVEAPQKWEATACTFAGIDYNALKTTGSSGPQSFANGFIGDYVTKLEDVVESYRLQENFHEGTDTAVISLRDDLFNVKAECATDGANLLYSAGQLDRTEAPGWGRQGCSTVEVDGQTLPAADCVTPKGLGEGPLFSNPVMSAVQGFELTFGAGSTQDAALVQEVDVQPGHYRFTFYTKAPAGCCGAGSGQVWADDSSMVTLTESGPSTSSSGWYRRYIRFQVNKAGKIKVGFKKVASAPVIVAAPMLERLNTSVATELVPFVNTGADLQQLRSACQDTDGSVFRSTRWTRDCVKLCADGFSKECSGDTAKSYCYWQTDFNIDQREIQRGRVFNFGGFARGNYNYRIDSLALNFVGAPRDCSNSASPQACYGAGYLPFSMAHVGPFVVRNHEGADVPVDVFDGNIEHARALATERYITNPISSSDASLVEQYMRHEFEGRPLDGNFVVRVWEEDGVDFGSIQDLQLVLKYRYWTKFN